MGEVGQMRSMLYQRDGVCRSRVNSTGLMKRPHEGDILPGAHNGSLRGTAKEIRDCCDHLRCASVPQRRSMTR